MEVRTPHIEYNQCLTANIMFYPPRSEEGDVDNIKIEKFGKTRLLFWRSAAQNWKTSANLRRVHFNKRFLNVKVTVYKFVKIIDFIYDST